MTRDEIVQRLEEALDGYFDLLDDLNDTDTNDLAENLAAAILDPRKDKP